MYDLLTPPYFRHEFLRFDSETSTGVVGLPSRNIITDEKNKVVSKSKKMIRAEKQTSLLIRYKNWQKICIWPRPSNN